ncbi:MAG: hypothetical protein QG635_2092 [Bacteroidota bacterium]|nr:hypothetical protein [Bacteroidota bacterium]
MYLHKIMKKIAIILLALLTVAAIACSPVRTKSLSKKKIAMKGETMKVEEQQPSEKKPENKKETDTLRNSKSKSPAELKNDKPFKQAADIKVKTNETETKKEQDTKSGQIAKNGHEANNNIEINKTASKDIKSKVKSPQTNSKTQKKSRFSDTTVIELAPVEPPSKIGIDDEFMLAVDKFDAEDYDFACKKFRELIETMPPDDSLTFEAKFFLCECSIYNKDLNTAEKMLKKLLTIKDMPGAVVEKALVRLGQIYCVLGKKKEAQFMFAKLKLDYPDSPLIKLANCDAVKGK